MRIINQNYISLTIWIVCIIASGNIVGFFTNSNINGWYTEINRSSLTPPNYVFPIVWTILYAMIGAAGFAIWNQSNFKEIQLLKNLYIFQILLNWLWSPLFFNYHLTGLAFAVIILMIILVFSIIYITYAKANKIALLLLPYLIWISFASYLNFYIWWNN